MGGRADRREWMGERAEVGERRWESGGVKAEVRERIGERAEGRERDPTEIRKIPEKIRNQRLG